MKKLIVIFLALASGLILNAKQDWNYKNYFRNDSAIVYSWDGTLNNWVLNSTQVYNYDANGKLNSVIVRSLPSGSNLSKTEYEYDGNGLLSFQSFFTWNVSWVAYARNLISYDVNNRTSEIMVQVFKGTDWANSRWQKNYKYDQEGRLTEFQLIYWINNAWSLPTTDYSTYDETGRLIKRLALYSNGNTDYQILYNYDEHGLRSEMYAQYPSGTGWFNWWLYNFQYNDCGSQTSQIQYKGIISDWIPQTKIVSFNSFNSHAFPGKKIPVCHKGNTIYISKNAVKAHLAHGDCIGECTLEKNNDKTSCDEKENQESPPFTIYPNPAKEKITIKFDRNEDCELKRVELTDFYGKLIKSFNIKENGDLTIDRGNLLSGKYYIRIVGEEVYSEVVIFE
jgi:hypothetical protein